MECDDFEVNVSGESRTPQTDFEVIVLHSIGRNLIEGNDQGRHRENVAHELLGELIFGSACQATQYKNEFYESKTFKHLHVMSCAGHVLEMA